MVDKKIEGKVEKVFGEWLPILKTDDATDIPIFTHVIQLVGLNSESIDDIRNRLFNEDGDFDFEKIKPLPGKMKFPKLLSLKTLVGQTLSWYESRLKGDLGNPCDELECFCYQVNDAARDVGHESILHWMRDEWDLVGSWEVKFTSKPSSNFSNYLEFEFESTCSTFFFHYLLDHELGLAHFVLPKGNGETVFDDSNPYAELLVQSKEYVDRLIEMGYHVKVVHRGERDYRHFVYLEHDWENDSPARKKLLANRTFVEELLKHLVKLSFVTPNEESLGWYACMNSYEKLFYSLLFNDDDIFVKASWVDGMPDSTWNTICNQSFKDSFNRSYEIY